MDDIHTIQMHAPCTCMLCCPHNTPEKRNPSTPIYPSVHCLSIYLSVHIHLSQCTIHNTTRFTTTHVGHIDGAEVVGDLHELELPQLFF